MDELIRLQWDFSKLSTLLGLCCGVVILVNIASTRDIPHPHPAVVFCQTAAPVTPTVVHTETQ